jgi:hypothetical protein
MAKLQILKLALKTGYSQNDFHRANLLVDPNYRGMYKGLPGKVLIIDFGLSSKITPENLVEIKKLAHDKKYQEALRIFKSFVRSDGLSISQYPVYYGWLYNEDTESAGFRIPKREDVYHDAVIGKLVTKEDQAIDERIQLFDQKHKENPEVYPLLPLSNAIKNQFFQGMIGGLRHKNVRRNREKVSHERKRSKTRRNKKV